MICRPLIFGIVFGLSLVCLDRASAACLKERVENFDLRELQSPVGPYENGPLQLSVKDFSVRDGKGSARFESNQPEFLGNADIENSTLTVTGYKVCHGAVVTLVCKFGLIESPCTIAENVKASEIEASIGMPASPLISQDGYVLACDKTHAKDVFGGETALSDEMKFMGLPFKERGRATADGALLMNYYAPDNSRIMLCRTAEESGCPTSRCTDVRVLKSIKRPRNLTTPEFVTRFSDGIYSVKNIGAPITNINVDIKSIFYVWAGAKSLTYPIETPVTPTRVSQGEMTFEIDLNPAKSLLDAAYQSLRKELPAGRLSLWHYSCVLLTYLDPKGKESKKLFSLRAFDNVGLRNADMHEDGDYYDCVDDFRTWKTYPKYFLKGPIRGDDFAARVIARVNEPSRYVAKRFGQWLYEHRPQAEQADDYEYVEAFPADGSDHPVLTFTCLQKYLQVGYWLGALQEEEDIFKSGELREFTFSVDGKSFTALFRHEQGVRYTIPGGVGTEILRHLLRGKTLEVAHKLKSGEEIQRSFDLSNAAAALEPIVKSCEIKP